MSDGIFPIVDRDTPVLDRIRGEDKEGSANDLGVLVGKVATHDDPEERKREATDVTEEFAQGLAESLDVEPQLLSDDVLEEFSSLLMKDEDELLVDELSELGEPSDDEEEGEEEDSSF